MPNSSHCQIALKDSTEHVRSQFNYLLSVSLFTLEFYSMPMVRVSRVRNRFGLRLAAVVKSHRGKHLAMRAIWHDTGAMFTNCDSMTLIEDQKIEHANDFYCLGSMIALHTEDLKQ